MRASSPGRLDVDRRQAEADRPVELGRRLADAGEDDLVRPEAGAQGDFDLAGRVGVGAGAQSAHAAGDGQRRVGLDRVVDAVRPAAERRVERAVARVHQRAAVDVDRRARRPRDLASATSSQQSSPCLV